MFGKWTNLATNFDGLQELAKNEHFRKFMGHPKVQALMKDSLLGRRRLREIGSNLWPTLNLRRF